MRAPPERAFMRARVRRAYARRYLTRRQSGIVMGHMRADHGRAADISRLQASTGDVRAHDERAFMRARVRRAYARRYLTRRQSGIVMGHMRANHGRAAMRSRLQASTGDAARTMKHRLHHGMPRIIAHMRVGTGRAGSLFGQIVHRNGM